MKFAHRLKLAWQVLCGNQIAAKDSEGMFGCVPIRAQRLAQLEHAAAELMFARGYIASADKIGYSAGLNDTIKS